MSPWTLDRGPSTLCGCSGGRTVEVRAERPGRSRIEVSRMTGIPASHRDLVECPALAALTTVNRDGYPHTSVVWCDVDDGCVRVNTMRGFVKERNMRRDAHVTLLCYDPHEP